ncbi:hypothetical protein BN1232_05782 [Mycobacterium lentiflavum]|uniref:Uncharacterized protein n=2 Tax=Mycobacterium lentiflavum TaxID=141349 RepID=A0A0E4H2N2_MYCLN|nr:hypothetical protein BN1232_05782 [Mycobacterium lentiflavum]
MLGRIVCIVYLTLKMLLADPRSYRRVRREPAMTVIPTARLFQIGGGWDSPPTLFTETHVCAVFDSVVGSATVGADAGDVVKRNVELVASATKKPAGPGGAIVAGDSAVGATAARPGKPVEVDGFAAGEKGPAAATVMSCFGDAEMPATCLQIVIEPAPGRLVGLDNLRRGARRIPASAHDGGD